MISWISPQGNEAGSGYPAANEIIPGSREVTVPIRLIADSCSFRPVDERNLSKSIMSGKLLDRAWGRH